VSSSDPVSVFIKPGLEWSVERAKARLDAVNSANQLGKQTVHLSVSKLCAQIVLQNIYKAAT
jgi:hypothetical protein